MLCWLVGADGQVHAKLMDRRSYQAKSFASWLDESLTAYEKEHPATRVPFQRARLRGTDNTPAAPAIEKARTDKQPILIYVGRDRYDEKDKQQKKQRKLAKSFEKKVLGSKSAAKLTTGWALVRFDLADDGHAKWLARFEVTEAPRLLLWLPDQDTPQDLGRKVTASSLASLLRKHAPASTRD